MSKPQLLRKHDFDNGDMIEMRQEVFHFASCEPTELIEVVYLEKDRLDGRTIYNCWYSQYVLPEDKDAADIIFNERLKSENPNMACENEITLAALEKAKAALEKSGNDLSL